MTKRYFGTDGIRGTANRFPMTAEMALRVGKAAGRFFRDDAKRRRLVVIGKDTRLSGYMIEPALVAGFTSVGMDVRLFGPLPTPGVAMMTRSMRADLGVMLTASHNPYVDNGIKLFGPDGYKLDDDAERAIEDMMDGGLEDDLAPPESLGRVQRIDDAQARYVEIVKATFPRKLRLNGLRIVVDCANGAAYRVAPTALYELGAEVIPLSVSPDGTNINEQCGTTAPETLAEKVLELRADLGVALDGDADRVVLVDERGRVIDGDQIIALISRAWAQAGRLAKPSVAATVMSNFGLERFLQHEGISLLRSKVGDRYVTELMRAKGLNLGGEQSGHIVLSDFTTTGDGMIAALQALAAMIESGLPASACMRVFEPMPQVLENVRFKSSPPLSKKAVKEAIKTAETQLGDQGRLVIRKSGTEPVVRIMAEGEDEALVRRVVSELADVVSHAAA